jgi:hypothetical protein
VGGHGVGEQLGGVGHDTAPGKRTKPDEVFVGLRVFYTFGNYSPT